MTRHLPFRMKPRSRLESSTEPPGSITKICAREHGCRLWRTTAAYLDYTSDKIREELVLLDLVSVPENLLLQTVLLIVIQGVLRWISVATHKIDVR